MVNIACSCAEGCEEVMHELQDLVGFRNGLYSGILTAGRHIAGLLGSLGLGM